MAGTALDMTSPRPGGSSPVYGVYGTIDDRAPTLAALLKAGAVLRQLSFDVLVALETRSPALRRDALALVAEHDGMPLLGAVGFDDWWTAALEALNPQFPLVTARRLVTDKAKLYAELRKEGATVPGFVAADLSPAFLREALDRFGPRPVLKPATGAGSRGVYRYQAGLSIDENLDLYRQLLALGHIDSSIQILAAEYLGGTQALEISADVIVTGGTAVQSVVHEKRTASEVHPFTDRIMVSPPTDPRIAAALPQLPPTIDQIIAALDLHDGALHVELRLHSGRWVVLDIGVRPGSGLVAHSTQALTGADPRLVHLRACIGQPIATEHAQPATATHAATCIACCYVTPAARPNVSLTRQGDLVDELRDAPDVIGWHLNAAQIDDQIYRPDAGLSIGVGAANPEAAITRLRSIVGPYHYTTG